MAELLDNDDPRFAFAALKEYAANSGALLRSHIEAFGFSGLETVELDVNAAKGLGTLLASKRYAGLVLDRYYAHAAAKWLAAHPTLGRLTERAARSGAVDLLLREGDGTLTGDDLAQEILEDVLRTHAPNLTCRTAHILVDPPASDAAAAQRERARSLRASLRALGIETALRVVDANRPGISLPEAPAAEPDLLLNASVFGTDAVFSDEPLFCERCEAAIPSENVEPKSAGGQRLPEPRLLVETAARPLRSHLLIEARRRGIPAVSGFELEVARARAVIEAFLGRPLRNCVSATIERDIRLEAENIVLIGMPGCGKTTIGKILAQRLMRRFVDVDELVAKHVGKFKARIYREEGEAFFREKETEAIRTLALKTGLIISTGGGSCLRPVNRALLGLNGRFIWLKRPLAKLATRDRPIAIARGVAALYEERAPIYSALADRTIEVSSIDETVRAILGEHA